MICPYCKKESSSLVRESRFYYFKKQDISARRRTRICSCGKSFQTLELTCEDLVDLTDCRLNSLAKAVKIRNQDETKING